MESWLDNYMKQKKYSPYDNSEGFLSIQPQKTQEVIQAPQQSTGEILTNTGTAGLQGGAMGSPAGAAIAAGGSLASQIIAQRAADARAQRERAANIEQTLGQNQQSAYNTILQSLGRAYR